jgi:hypothetical protein
MDPYLEHPVLWESVHKRLIIAMANYLQPQLDPRYVASIEERVFVEGPQRRIPDVWVTEKRNGGKMFSPKTKGDTAVVLEVEEEEFHEPRIELLDLYDNMRLVTAIEIVSPTNKKDGPGRDSYEAKRTEILERSCHFVEIDLLRRGRHVLSIPDWRVQELRPYDYLVCVSRHPWRNRFELYPRALRERLPRIRIPLVEPDPDVVLDIQATLEQIYSEGRYLWRVRYHEPCIPPLDPVDQQWADERWSAYRAAHPEWFPTEAPPTGKKRSGKGRKKSR